jgi:hypothetical protein
MHKLAGMSSSVESRQTRLAWWVLKKMEAGDSELGIGPSRGACLEAEHAPSGVVLPEGLSCAIVKVFAHGADLQVTNHDVLIGLASCGCIWAERGLCLRNRPFLGPHHMTTSESRFRQRVAAPEPVSSFMASAMRPYLGLH